MAHRLRSGPGTAVFALALALALGFTVPPCIWDRDTLTDELRGLPQGYELLVGRWFRHGQAYYQQRIDTLPAHLDKKPGDLAVYDDLAVAYERLRDRAKAIAVMARKRKALAAVEDKKSAGYKEQLYRYHANLGTFYAHSGKFDEALVELRKAIEINPNAHFGRERFQIDLIRYVAAARKDPTLWTKHNFLTFTNYQIRKKGWFTVTGALSFSGRVRRSRNEDDHKWATWEEAYTGVAGMLRFGGLEGPELYRTLGDLLLIKRDLNLAWWAYRRAVERGHPAAARLEKACEGIDKHWAEASRLGPRMHGLPTMATFRKARTDADRWLEVFLREEKKALAADKDTGKPEVLKALIAVADKEAPLTVPSGRTGRGAGRTKGKAQPAKGAAEKEPKAKRARDR